MADKRLHTVFDLCATHAAFFAGEGRYRTAEFFAEGGPSSACTLGRACRIRPGTDLFVPELCDKGGMYSTADATSPFAWAGATV